MRPILVDVLARWLGYPVADLVAPSYFTMAAVAVLVGALLVVRRARREGDDVSAVLAALAWGYAAAILCGIACPIVADLADQIVSGPFVGVRWAGMVAYGGFIGGFVAAGLSLRRTRTVSFARFADLAAAPVGLAIAFVRTGCFIAGCDYGKVTGLPWAIRFPPGSPAFVDQVQAGLLPATRAASLPVHPTQLYEVALGVLIFVVVGRLGKLRWRAGTQFLAACALYAVGRAVVEIFRGDASRGLWGPLSTSQLIGIFVLAGCAAVALRSRAVAVAAALLVGLALALPASARADEAVVTSAPEPQNGFDLGVGIGATSPLNRRNGQVPQLFALSATGTYTLAAPWGIGLLYEDATNSVAIQTTFAGVLSYRPALANRLDAVILFGIGGTTVNFRDASFSDVLAFDWRVSGGLAYMFLPNLSVTLTPFALDVIQAPDLGGTIVGYQFLIGLSYGTRHSSAASPAGQTPPPAPQPTTLPTPKTPYY